jgi:hypothetical protein
MTTIRFTGEITWDGPFPADDPKMEPRLFFAYIPYRGRQASEGEPFEIREWAEIEPDHGIVTKEEIETMERGQDVR